MSHKLFMIGTLLCGLLLCALIAEAQDSGDAPKPAMAGDSVSAALQADEPQDTPDTRPLAGAQNLSLGSKSASHSFLLPSFGMTTQVQLNPYNSSQANSPSLISTTYLSGRLGVNKISGRSELLVDYLTGGEFSSDSNQGNSIIQSLDFAETVRWGRWSQMFGDQFTYLPASSFGFGGLGGLNNLGVSLGSAGSTPGFRQDILPNQSIMTNGARRISNAVITQTSYALGYRSSLTFGASYGVLHFIDGGFQDSSSASFSGGYNYLLSPKNSMSVSYGFTRLMLSNLAQGMDDHRVQLSFARRITGRLSIQVGAGPDVQLFRARLAGPSTVVNWAFSSALLGTYQFRHLEAGFNYSHSLSGGSGVLPGAETSALSGQLGRAFRDWHTSVSVGYSRNRALQQTILDANAISPQGWFATAQAGRHFARYGSLFVSYNASGQSSLAAVCSLPACRVNTLTQTVSIGYNWGFRPILLE
jgi:hypothetical protein